MPFATVNGLQLYFERAGAGAPLLFISGTGGDLRVKPNQFDGPFPKAFDMISYDQRGLGRSDKPDERYSMADYADDAAALMESQGWASAHVIGVSFGGMVAQELALRHPGRIRRLVLACTSPGGAGGASFAFHEIEHLKGARTTTLGSGWARSPPRPWWRAAASMASPCPQRWSGWPAKSRARSCDSTTAATCS